MRAAGRKEEKRYFSSWQVTPRYQAVFLVGCPRSGTTLLQSMLATHSLISSFPESHFFAHLTPRPALAAFDLASRHTRRRLREFLRECGREELMRLVPRLALFRRQYLRAFVAALDELAAAQRKTIWVEKTPRHLHYVEQIAAMIRGVKFLHLMRNGADVVASLYEVSQKHPEVWGARTLEECVERWISDLQLSLHYRGQPGHHLVRYEELITEPRQVLAGVCRFLEIEFEEAMLSEYQEAARRLVSEGESWKENVRGKLGEAGGKFSQLFTPEEQQYILSRLEKFDLDRLLAEKAPPPSEKENETDYNSPPSVG